MVKAAVLLSAFALGCSGTVLRDRDTYVTEVAFTDRLVREGSGAVRDVLIHQCECQSGTWVSISAHATDRVCREYADWWMVYAARWSWHRSMMLYNGRLLEVRPPARPVIPPTTCEIPDAR